MIISLKGCHVSSTDVKYCSSSQVECLERLESGRGEGPQGHRSLFHPCVLAQQGGVRKGGVVVFKLSALSPLFIISR